MAAGFYPGMSPYLPFNTSPVIEKHVENLIALTLGPL